MYCELGPQLFMDETKLNPRILNLKFFYYKLKLLKTIIIIIIIIIFKNLQQSTTINIQQKINAFYLLEMCPISYKTIIIIACYKLKKFQSSYYNKIVDHENTYELKIYKNELIIFSNK
jgi:hypothetical protein